jgi:hypothetical protein
MNVGKSNGTLAIPNSDGGLTYRLARTITISRPTDR